MRTAVGTHRRTVIHVGPSARARGGVSATIGLLMESDLSSRYALRRASSVGGGRGPIRYLAFLGCLATVAASAPVHPLVHLHVASHGSFVRKYIVSRIARLMGMPYVAHIHGGGFADFAAAGGRGRHARVARFLRESACVIALSQTWVVRLKAIAPEVSPRVIRNPITTSATLDARVAGPVPVILFAGHLEPHKGIATLAESLCALDRAGTELELRVAGDGPQRALLETLGSELAGVRIVLLGWIDTRTLREEMRTADIFVLPSYVEGVPLALLEAMSEGAAVVATRVGGVPDVVEDGETGLLVDAHDATALTAALARLCELPALRERLGSAAVVRVRREHSVAAVADELTALYEELGFPADTAAAS